MLMAHQKCLIPKVEFVGKSGKNNFINFLIDPHYIQLKHIMSTD